MLNQIVLVGRIIEDVKIKESESGKKVANVILAVSRSYKNIDGIYETDFIPVIMFQPTAQSVVDYCKKGDVVGVKGRIQMKNEKIQLIAEKVMFLSSKKENE